ncbi:MAG: hypothetical protein QXO12_01285 [Candidatus Pacearchaeota archaeon]
MKNIVIFILILFFVLVSIPLSYSGTSHGVVGKVLDSCDGTRANGAKVTFYILTRPDDKLYDVVGPRGNSGKDNYYFVDIGNFIYPWQSGETLIIEIFKDEDHAVNISINLTDAGFDVAPTVKLPGYCPNHPPIIVSYYPQNLSVITNKPINFWVYAIDEDGDNLVLKWYVNGEEVKSEENNSNINSSFYFSYNIGEYTVKAVVSDYEYNTSVEWQVKIINNPPEIIYYLPNKTYITTNTTIEFFVIARDIDEDDLVLKWYVNNEEKKQKFGKGNINDTFIFTSSPGYYIIKAEVSDGIGSDRVIWSVNFSGECIDYWECGNWSECDEMGFRYRGCLKINPECQSNINQPPMKIFDPECLNLTCTPNFVCGDWSECIAKYNLEEVIAQEPPYYVKGKMYKECKDITNCTNLSRVFEKNCSLYLPIEINRTIQCEVAFIFIKDLRTNQTLVKIKKPIEFTGVDIYIASREGKQYCWYCFNGKKDYDEVDVDCGGPNCPPCTLKQIPPKRHNLFKYFILLLFFLVLILYIISKIKEIRENVNPIEIFRKIIKMEEK